MNDKGSKLLIPSIFSVLLFALSSPAQSNFENLNFEAANISANELIPGWSSSSPLVYDNYGSGGSLVTLVDSNKYSYNPLQGNYSVVLIGGTDFGYSYPSYISQTGLVPAYAQSIQMDLSVLGYPAATFVVTLGGQTISMSPLQTCSNYTVYGGNISAYAGQTETLTITQNPPVDEYRSPGALEVDNILFSPAVVPEPPPLTILSTNGQVIVSWPLSYSGWILQTNTDLTTTNWANFSGAVVNNCATNSTPSGNLFFRLYAP